ncbi:MAG: DUF624 domain-containing protein [Ruminococcaceae bacterium]|nr:DUF624 domain-containing protein [Oscillospiraceae bacterium]
MNKWFDMDSPIMTALSRMTDMVILSILWFVCCLPIFTIGPATVAMYYVALKWARKEEVKISSAFFQAFKKNFKQGVIMNLLFLVVGAVLLADYFIMATMNTSRGDLSSTVFLVMGIWMLCIMFYAYPMQAQFFNTIRQTLINAALLSARKFGVTVIVFVLNMLPVILGFISLEVLVRTAPVWVLLAPGVVAFVNAKLFAKLFDPFLKAAQEENAEKTETE